MLIPFPGTPLFERLASEKRILHKDWSKYDGSYAVFQPANMTPEELEEGTDWFWNEIRKKKASNSVPHKKDKADSRPRSVRNDDLNRGPALSTGGAPIRWKSILALCFIGIGLIFNWYWIWGALLIIWGISDLRSRYTYLLDEIPRMESPILYWIVVFMWLTMGIWALSNSPVLEDLTETVKAKISTSERQDSTSVQMENHRQQNMQRGRNERFGFAFQSPELWQLNEQKDSDSITIHLQNAKNTATITAIAFDYRARMSLKHLIAYMEKEFQPDLTFIKNAQTSTPKKPLKVGEEGTQMFFKEYRGSFEGANTTARVGYAVHNSYGYALIGVFADRDRGMEDFVNRSLTSFRLLTQ